MERAPVANRLIYQCPPPFLANVYVPCLVGSVSQNEWNHVRIERELRPTRDHALEGAPAASPVEPRGSRHRAGSTTPAQRDDVGLRVDDARGMSAASSRRVAVNRMKRSMWL